MILDQAFSTITFIGGWSIIVLLIAMIIYFSRDLWMRHSRRINQYHYKKLSKQERRDLWDYGWTKEELEATDKLLQVLHKHADKLAAKRAGKTTVNVCGSVTYDDPGCPTTK